MRSRSVNEAEQWVIAYWLLPAAPARDFFRETIQRLGFENDAPIFEPHLTFAVGSDSGHEAARELAKLPGGLVKLRVIGVGWTSRFTRSLFVRFESSPHLLQLRSSLGANEQHDFDPHLSLLYKKIPEEEQLRLATEIQLPFTQVSFDTVAATRCRMPVNGPDDVAVWKTVAARRLIREETR